jgi:hypothetical protein
VVGSSETSAGATSHQASEPGGRAGIGQGGLGRDVRSVPGGGDEEIEGVLQAGQLPFEEHRVPEGEGHPSSGQSEAVGGQPRWQPAGVTQVANGPEVHAGVTGRRHQFEEPIGLDQRCPIERELEDPEAHRGAGHRHGARRPHVHRITGPSGPVIGTRESGGSAAQASRTQW